jgi:hypothetical protein
MVNNIDQKRIIDIFFTKVPFIMCWSIVARLLIKIDFLKDRTVNSTTHNEQGLALLRYLKNVSLATEAEWKTKVQNILLLQSVQSCWI